MKAADQSPVQLVADGELQGDQQPAEEQLEGELQLVGLQGQAVMAVQHPAGPAAVGASAGAAHSAAAAV